MLLGALPGCVSIGELRHMWRRGIQLNQRCGCGEPFWDCPFWSAVGDRAFGGWDNAPHERMLDLQRQVDRYRQLPRLATMPVAAGVRRTVDEYAGNVGRVYRAVEEVAQSSTVIDSSKSPTFAVILQRVPGIDPVVLHLIRDSRAVAHSWSRRRSMPEVVEGQAYMATYGPARAAIGPQQRRDRGCAFGRHRQHAPAVRGAGACRSTGAGTGSLGAGLDRCTDGAAGGAGCQGGPPAHGGRESGSLLRRPRSVATR
jgi:hypothetical protein